MWKHVILAVSACLFLVMPLQAAQMQNLNAAQASEMLQKQDGVFLLDVRTPQEYLEVRLADSTLIPIDQVQKRLAEIPKQRPIIVYCAVGSRSSRVGGYLAQAGYGPIYNLYGGIWGWQVRGLPVVKGAP